MEEVGPLKKSTQPLAYTAKQPRINVQKDLMFFNGNQRLQACLKGDDAELVLDHNGKRTDVLEKIQHVRCVMQEELSDDQQIVRYLESDSATYHYQTGRLVAQNVDVFRYAMPGNLLPQDLSEGRLIMGGEAKDVDFSLFGDDANLHAEHVKMTIYLKRDVQIEAVEADFDGILLSLSGNVVVKHHLGKISADYVEIDPYRSMIKGEQGHLQDQMGEVFADAFCLDYEEMEDGLAITKITLMENVRIMNRFIDSSPDEQETRQYALADVVELFPASKEMKLHAKQGHRVLFYDQGNGLQVSAPVVKVVRGSAQNKETIEGEGDVRFHFAESEFDELRQRFLFEENKKGSGYDSKLS